MNNYKFLKMRVDELGRKKMTQGELAKELNIDRNRIQQLETSPKVIPKEEELRAYCEYFNTTSDYLLGLSKSKPINEDIAMISKTTGFSDTSIDRIKKYTKLQKDIVDKLLSTRAMEKIIDAYIYRNSQYFQKIEIIDSICGKRTASDKENSDYHFFQSVEMLKEAINIISNDKELFYELNDIHGEKASERFWKIAVDMEIKNIGIEKTLANLLKDKRIVPDYIIDYVKELQENQKRSDSNETT